MSNTTASGTATATTTASASATASGTNANVTGTTEYNDLYFFSEGQMQNNPRHVSILGYEGDRPLFFRFSTKLSHTSAQTRVYRDQQDVAVLDWTAGTHLGLLTIGQRQVHMTHLVRQLNSNVREFVGPDDGVKFEWRRTPAHDYELYAPSDCRIASYSRVAYQTKWGACHGLFRYTFKNRESLLLEALLALCLNRWIDMNSASS